MKALSIRQPWAWAILFAGKDIENRDWRTDYRGPVLIHTGKGCTVDEYEDGLATFRHVGRQRPFPSGLTLPRLADLPRGGIVGEAEIVDCVTRSDSPWFFGKYGFVLRNARSLPFQPCRGQLGFFEPDLSGPSRQTQTSPRQRSLL